MQQTITLMDIDVPKCIPFENVIEALNYMAYGSTERVMFKMLYYTGARISELDNMKISMLFGNKLHWELGKNQHGIRSEELPEDFIKELIFYRKGHRVYGDKIFGISNETFGRYFNKFIRSKLPSPWQAKKLVFRHGKAGIGYVLQIKGLRKNKATLGFWKEYTKWKNSDVALEFACKKMQHSSKRITAVHYIENFEALRLERFGTYTTEEILKKACQKPLTEYY